MLCNIFNEWILLHLISIEICVFSLADLHPTSSNVNWKVVCPDVSLTYYKPDGDDPILLYTIILVVPVVFVSNAPSLIS